MSLPEEYLPKEKESDWFETIETIDLRNHRPLLINIIRQSPESGSDECKNNNVPCDQQIQDDVKQQSHEHSNNFVKSFHSGSYDFRGIDKTVCPKFVVSPWLQSSAEPDKSTKSLCE